MHAITSIFVLKQAKDRLRLARAFASRKLACRSAAAMNTKQFPRFETDRWIRRIGIDDSEEGGWEWVKIGESE